MIEWVSQSIHDSTEAMWDNTYYILDTTSYYAVNCLMLTMEFADDIGEMVDQMSYNYMILLKSVKHKMYNNIN